MAMGDRIHPEDVVKSGRHRQADSADGAAGKPEKDVDGSRPEPDIEPEALIDAPGS